MLYKQQKKKLRMVKNSVEIKNDISMLQLCNSVHIFEKAWELFSLKWCNIQPDIDIFLEYFQEEWLKKFKLVRRNRYS